MPNFEEGKMFDLPLSAAGKALTNLDMVLMPDASTAVIDLFFADSALDYPLATSRARTLVLL